MVDTLDCNALDAALLGTIFSGKLHLFPSIDSTNTLAMQQAAQGAPHGSVYLAEEQTAGKGRGDHAWHSEPGTGVYVSVLLRPQMTPADGLWLSLATGLAIQHAIENVTGLVADIRWPNDLLLGSRKVGGILTEMNAEAARVRHAVIGIGINVNHRQFPLELRDLATSLRLETERVPSRQDLLIAILQRLLSETDPLMQSSSFAAARDGILTRLQQKSSWIRGKQVIVDEAGGYTGVTAGLDGNGFLRVQTADGIRTVLSGGVRSGSAKG
jgi:BirA family transcriptional regulator, biotin operon repressor / biotin---[acetyl-CoA-carboxylase] ligase